MNDADRVLLNGFTSFYFRQFAADHNAAYGRYMSWADARALWQTARINARRMVCGA